MARTMASEDRKSLDVPIAGHNAPDVQLVIVVLAYGSGDNVSDLLGSLRREMITAANKLIVVHNPSRPGETLALSGFDDISLVELAANRGYVGGMNAGIDLALQSNPAFVLLLTHDIRIVGSDVQRLISLLSDHSSYGVIGPILGEPDMPPYSAGIVRSHCVRMQHRLPAGDVVRPLWPCPALDGSAMMWRATALEATNGFDERFFMYFDDVDICARAMKCGWRLAAATDVYAISAPGKGNRRTAHAYLRARNGLAYARVFGRSGLLAGLVECAIGLWHATPKPGGRRFRDPQARQFAAQYWRGTLLGMVDYFRGRWGPPPSRIMRDGDIAATSS